MDSFEVREGTGGVKPLTDANRADIKNTLRGKILNTAAHPAITFVSSQVSGTAESFRIDGDLTIAGVTQPVTVEGQLTAGRAYGSAVIVQSRWGIPPTRRSWEHSSCATRSRSSSTSTSQQAADTPGIHAPPYGPPRGHTNCGMCACSVAGIAALNLLGSNTRSWR